MGFLAKSELMPNFDGIYILKKSTVCVGLISGMHYKLLKYLVSIEITPSLPQSLTSSEPLPPTFKELLMSSDIRIVFLS